MQGGINTWLISRTQTHPEVRQEMEMGLHLWKISFKNGKYRASTDLHLFLRSKQPENIVTKIWLPRFPIQDMEIQGQQVRWRQWSLRMAHWWNSFLNWFEDGFTWSRYLESNFILSAVESSVIYLIASGCWIWCRHQGWIGPLAVLRPPTAILKLEFWPDKLASKLE